MSKRKKRLSPAPRLLIYGVSQEAWTRRHGVEPFEVECDCGRMLRTTIPYVEGPFRGLEAPKCECGVHDKPDARGWWHFPPYGFVRDSSLGDLLTGRDR